MSSDDEKTPRAPMESTIPDPRDPTEIVHRFIAIHRLDLAEDAVREELAENPNDLRLLHLLSAICFDTGRVDEAGDIAYSLLQQSPEWTEPKRILGLVARARRRFRESEQWFLEVLRPYPEDPVVLLDYAHLLAQVDQPTKAEAILNEVLRIDPENHEAHYLLTTLYADIGRFRAAWDYSRAILRLAPDESTSHVAVGIAAYKSGRARSAREHFREALRMNPQDYFAESMYVRADRATRWVYLPIYSVECLIERLPGKQSTAWVIFVSFAVIYFGVWSENQELPPPLGIGVLILGFIFVSRLAARICMRIWPRN